MHSKQATTAHIKKRTHYANMQNKKSSVSVRANNKYAAISHAVDQSTPAGLCVH